MNKVNITEKHIRNIKKMGVALEIEIIIDGEIKTVHYFKHTGGDWKPANQEERETYKEYTPIINDIVKSNGIS